METTTDKRPLPPPGQNRERQYMMLGLRIIGDFGATIAVPVVLLSLLGKWMDAKYGTKPYFLIAGFAVAATVSSIMIVRKAKAYGKMYQDIDPPKPKE